MNLDFEPRCVLIAIAENSRPLLGYWNGRRPTTGYSHVHVGKREWCEIGRGPGHPLGDFLTIATRGHVGVSHREIRSAAALLTLDAVFAFSLSLSLPTT